MGKKKKGKKKGGKKKEAKEEVKVEEVEEIDEEPFIILELKASEPERARARQWSQTRRRAVPRPSAASSNPCNPMHHSLTGALSHRTL
jgi:hypothetical protein